MVFLFIYSGGFLIRRNISFDNDADLENFKNMGKELGYISLPSFAKNAMQFMYLYKTRNDEMFVKMDLILSKMEEVQNTSIKSAERVEKKIDDSFEKFLEAPTDSEFKQVYDLLVNVLIQNPDEWLSFEDFKRKMGIDGNKLLEEILQKIIMNNQEFKSKVERRGRFFKARNETLPMDDITYIVRD